MSLSELFRHRIQLSSVEKRTLGAKALLVFDTNVLLSLYRFAPRTRAETFPLLRRLKGRTWIPHYVGIEFFRNRQQYLSEDAARHEVSRKRVEDAFQALLDEMDDVELDKLGSSLDISTLRNQIAQVRDTFVTELKAVAEQYTALKDNDEVLQLLDELSDGCVGPSFINQGDLDSIYAEGEQRYKRKQPPGYKDDDKREDEYWQDGLIYKRKFGDLILWKQLLAAASVDTERFANVVFVTQDPKEDWWERNGHEIVGPRPELTEEGASSGIACFHMCTLERLLVPLVTWLEMCATTFNETEENPVSDRRRGSRGNMQM